MFPPGLKRVNEGRSHASRVVALFLALSISLTMILVVAPAASALPVRWDGGMDAQGWTGPAKTICFAEGTTRDGFEEYLMLRNPGLFASNVKITYQLQGGEVQSQSLPMEPNAGAVICVNDAVGAGKDVSTLIEADPGVIAERQIYFNYKGVWMGGTASCGVAGASTESYFAEGTTRSGFQEWLCLQNPGDTDALAELTYMLGDGRNLPQDIAVKAHSRETIDVNKAVGPGADVSVLVRSSVPLVVERPMYFDYKSAWRGGSDVSAATKPASQFYFAEGTTRSGFEEWLTIMNPGNDTTVTVDYMFAQGTVLTKTYALRGRARTTLFVNAEVGPEKDVSMRVSSPGQILCERPMYFKYHGAWEGGHVVMGSGTGSSSWYFPSVPAGEGFESWLCMMNAGSQKVTVNVEEPGEANPGPSKQLTIEPGARATVDLNALSAGQSSGWLRISSTGDIVCERPTYFSYDPRVNPQPVTFAKWGNLELKCPIRYCDLIGIEFHEGESGGSNVQAMQPIGLCLKNDNPSRRHPSVSFGTDGDPAYWVETSRARGTYSTSACDVHSKEGAVVYAPISGNVMAAESYMLYGKYPDLMVKIAIDGSPGFYVEVLHMKSLMVSKGQRVEAGVTPIGTVRNLVVYFNDGPNPYTREEGNHAHVQINNKLTATP